MTILYYDKKNQEYEKTIAWFKNKHLSIKTQNVKKITEKEIFQLVYLSNLEILDIIRKDIYSPLLKLKVNKLKKMRFSECLTYLQENNELLQLPIVLSSHVSLSGYNEEKLEELLNVS